MSVSLMSLSSRASKRRINEIDKTIDALAESLKDMQDMELQSKLLSAKLKKEKLVALQAVAKSQIILAEMEILIAENELNTELAQLKNCKKLKMCNDRSRKIEKSKLRKPQSQAYSCKKKISSDLIPIKENAYRYNKSPIPLTTKPNSTLNDLKIAIPQKHETTDKVQPPTPVEKEPLSCPVDKLAIENKLNHSASISTELLSPIDQVVKEHDLKPVAPVRKKVLGVAIHKLSTEHDVKPLGPGKDEPLISLTDKVTKDYKLKPILITNESLSPPNTHTNLNNISNLVIKPNGSRHAEKHSLKIFNQDLNKPNRFGIEDISKIESSKHGKCSSHSGNLKKKYDDTKITTNSRADQKQKASLPNRLMHVKKPIQAKPNKNKVMGKKYNEKNKNGHKMDPAIHRQIINDLFKEIMQSKSEEQVSRSMVSDKTPLLCFKCGFVNEDHMCEHTIREILENC